MSSQKGERIDTHGYPAFNPSVEKTEINAYDPSVILDPSSLPQAATASPKKHSASLDQKGNTQSSPLKSCDNKVKSKVQLENVS